MKETPDSILKKARFVNFEDYQSTVATLRRLLDELDNLRAVMPEGFSLVNHLEQQQEIHPDVLSVFPQGEHIVIEEQWPGGIALRDWFAGMALQGLIAHDDDSVSDGTWTFQGLYSKTAFEYADAMLAERTKK